MVRDKKDYINIFKEKGYKLTNQRIAILESILENQGKHLSGQEIYEYVHRKHPEIGVATVYRTLPLLVKMNIVYGSNFGDGCIRYELAKEKEGHRHHHTICLKCGKIQEVEEDLLDSIESEIFKTKKFKVTNHRVKFYGYCDVCLKKQKELSEEGANK